MPVQSIQPGPVWPINSGVIYALPGSACNIISPGSLERSNVYTGPFVGWAGGYNHVGGFVRALASTTIQAVKIKMKEMNTFPSYQSVIMNDKPSYYWSLNEESGTIAADSIGGANGTISGGVTLNQPGAVGKGMLFDGVAGSRVTIPPPFNFGLGSCSIECWIKTTINLSFKYIVDFKNNGASGFPGIGFLTGGAGQLYIDIMGPVTGTSIGAVFNYYDGNWHHIVGTITRGFPDTGRLYVDGVQIAQGDPLITGLTLTSTTPAGIGSYGGGTINNFNGLIDEVAIYPYALSPQQISSHYLAKSVPPNSYASAIMASKPTNYWQLDEEGGLVANDIVGGKHGTISGGVTLNQVGIGKSMLFDGVDDKIVTTPIQWVSTITIEGWIKGTNINNYGTVFSNRFNISSAFSNITFCIINHRPGIYANQGTPSQIIGNKIIDDNQWHHIVYIIAASTLLIYVDGQLDSTNSFIQSTALTANQCCIGYDLQSAGQALNGNIDEVAIYNRALPASEILAHYNARIV